MHAPVQRAGISFFHGTNPWFYGRILGGKRAQEPPTGSAVKHCRFLGTGGGWGVYASSVSIAHGPQTPQPTHQEGRKDLEDGVRRVRHCQPGEQAHSDRHEAGDSPAG